MGRPTGTAGAFQVGHQVVYHAAGAAEENRSRQGMIAGAAVVDRYTETTWVPVRASEQAADREPHWVRADNIVDVLAT
ncbi:hypothetical protein [Amycolatopsis magusensis]|nr:hypothetical protein [Amycolatopsis magusensis]MDI5976910.1 hypothetical protein [Amycolatopsis magusensis]